MGKFFTLVTIVVLVSSCATKTTSTIESVELEHSESLQRQAQNNVVALNQKPILKRKVAIGRFSSAELRRYSLLGMSNGEQLSKRLSDKLNSSLVQSGEFIVLQRSDLERLDFESTLSGGNASLVGVDTLLFGSITEYGRKTTGQAGFLSRSKKQVALAKVEINLVDVTTGQIYHAVTGAGEASSETSATVGMGATAGYDGTLGDKAINNAISDAVNKMLNTLLLREWSTGVLAVDDGLIYLAGGERQGLRKGMRLKASIKGRIIESPQTGFPINLPSKVVAELQVVDFFGENETNEGAVCQLVDGSINDEELSSIIILELK